MCAVFGFNDKFDMLLENYYINNWNYGTALCVCVCVSEFDILLNVVDPFSVVLWSLITHNASLL